jgi:2-oxo-4-hydroxy-4-carboxy--5-ureidoimidazoline (OHCU) decarboxylase
MNAHPKAAGLLAVTEGMTRKEVEEAKAGFSRREGEEECA